MTDAGRTTTGLNAWLAVTLMALGLHNLPLAAPSLLNIGYRLHSRRAIGMAIVSVAVVFNVALFVGALIFMASGQSFEQFRGWNDVALCAPHACAVLTTFVEVSH